jgi:Zn finger protein HypA/HybF involved in hydrogenase expression
MVEPRIVSVPGASIPSVDQLSAETPIDTAPGCAPSESKRLPCDACGHPMEPEHAHYKCRACGYIQPCCGW